MKGYLLRNETEVVAVIGLTDKDNFYANMRTAIAEHYDGDAGDVGLEISNEEYKADGYPSEFDVDLAFGGDSEIRRMYLELVYIY